MVIKCLLGRSGGEIKSHVKLCQTQCSTNGDKLCCTHTYRQKKFFHSVFLTLAVCSLKLFFKIQFCILAPRFAYSHDYQTAHQPQGWYTNVIFDMYQYGNIFVIFVAL